MNSVDPTGHVSEAVLGNKILAILGIAYAAKAAMGALIAKVTAILLIIAPYLAIVIAILAIAVAAYVIAKAVQQSREKAQEKADAQARQKVKRNKYIYYECGIYSGLISVGRGITQARAVSRLRTGRNVITYFGYNARKVTAIAGRKAPTYHRAHGGKGYFRHYHMGKYENSAHCFYLV